MNAMAPMYGPTPWARENAIPLLNVRFQSHVQITCRDRPSDSDRQAQRFEMRLRDVCGYVVWTAIYLNPSYWGDCSFE